MCSSQCTRVFLCTRRLSASVLMWYVLGMYWYVLGGISKYLHVLDQILIADILIQCHTAFQSTFNAICTVDTPELSLNWISSPQDGQRERPWPKHQCRTVPLRFQSQAYPHTFIPSWVVLAQHCWESFLYVSAQTALIDVYLHALVYMVCIILAWGTAEVAQWCSGCQWLARGLPWPAANLPSHLLTTPQLPSWWARSLRSVILTNINLNVIYLKVRVSLRHCCSCGALGTADSDGACLTDRQLLSQCWLCEGPSSTESLKSLASLSLAVIKFPANEMKWLAGTLCSTWAWASFYVQNVWWSIDSAHMYHVFSF